MKFVKWGWIHSIKKQVKDTFHTFTDRSTAGEKAAAQWESCCLISYKFRELSIIFQFSNVCTGLQSIIKCKLIYYHMFILYHKSLHFGPRMTWILLHSISMLFFCYFCYPVLIKVSFSLCSILYSSSYSYSHTEQHNVFMFFCSLNKSCSFSAASDICNYF